MAEAKKRSEVESFVHNRSYPRQAKQPQLSLFDGVLGSDGQVLSCSMNVQSLPEVGTQVVVRASSSEHLEVLWGNEIIANVNGVSKRDFSPASQNASYIPYLVARVVRTHEDTRQFGILLGHG